MKSLHGTVKSVILLVAILTTGLVALRAEAQAIRFTAPLADCLAAPGTPMLGTLDIYSLTCERLEGGVGLIAYNQQNLYVASVGPGVYNIRVKIGNWLSVWVRNVNLVWGGITVTFPQAMNGDADGDDSVDLRDVTTLLINFGTSSTPPITGDLNWDGQVTLLDLTILLLRFGNTGSPC